MTKQDDDSARTVALLWRQPVGGSRRGPPQGHTVDQIVEAAIAVADADGLDAVTMRRVAEAMRVAPMTLYTYVPGKAALVELMLDAAYAQMSRSRAMGSSWRDRLEAVARDNWALYQAHPWAAAVSPSRPPLGPGLLAKYDYELRAFAGTGLDDVSVDAALTFALGFVQSSARAAAEAQAVQRCSEMTDEQWWEANAPLLAKVSDPAAFPEAARIGAAAGAALGGAYNPEHAYEFGLQRVLDGLGVIIDRREPAN